MALSDWAENVKEEEATGGGGLSKVGDFFSDLWSDITGVTAAEEAGEAQQAGTEAYIAELEAQRQQQGEQWEKMRQLLDPYVQAGTGALQQQQALSGALGPQAQQQAIAGIQQSPAFQSALQRGETSILQSAAATGGVRGGRTQDALAQFSPQLLGQAIDRQYSQLGGLAGLGQASAAGVGAAGMGVGQSPGIAQGLQQMGQQQAANILGQYNLKRGFLGDIAGLGIQLAGLF